MLDEIVDGILVCREPRGIRLGIDGLLDISGAQPYPGHRSLWAWLAKWCVDASDQHQATVTRIARFSTFWHDMYERQPEPVFLGLAPAAEEHLSQISAAAGRVSRAPRATFEIEPSSTWLAEGEQRFADDVGAHYGSPESIAAGGMLALEHDDIASALFFFQKAVDLLHTTYVNSQMRNRAPGRRDGAVLDLYVRTLRNVRKVAPDADVGASVREVTHRLRTITTACQDAGVDPSLYLEALADLAAAAPDVDVRTVLWRNASLQELFGEHEIPEERR
ncbi:hypothetical protein OHS58_24510 [Amycolatopsis sp. NBC_00348]|uniref:hypothetical protein n=1 Tax=Amycolatopsis sp. NBC_00348 TaxID=2975956 RepID=UPI002E26DCA2